MKHTEVHNAARAFVTNHQTYITDWVHAWLVGMFATIQAGVNVPIAQLGGIMPDWDAMQPQEIVLFFHNFWECLPSSPSIRGEGFDDLCDIATNLFGFDDEEESTDLALAN